MLNQENKGQNKNFVMVNYELFDVIKKLSGNEYKLFMRIFRDTIGWQKEESYLANTYLSTKTGISVNTIRTLIESLVSKNMLSVRQIGSLGTIKQIIKINLNTNSFIFPEKNKLKERVKNFFNKTGEPIKQVFSNEKIVLTPPTVGGGTPPILGGGHLQPSEGTPPTIEDIINTNHKNNYKHHIHIDKNGENKKPFSSNLETKKTIVKENAYDDSKNFDKNKTSNVFNISNLSETKKYRADLLMSFGIETKNKSFISFLEIDTQEIKEQIAHAEWEQSQGRIKSTKQAFLCYTLSNFLKEQNKENNNFVSNDKNVFSAGAGAAGAGEIKKPNYLQGEISFKTFAHEKGLIYSIENDNTLEIAIKSSVGYGLTNKKFLLELKDLGFTKQKMDSFIEKAKQINPYLFTQPANRLEKKDLEQFYINLENPSILDKETKEPFKPTINNLYSKIKEVSKKIENVFNNNQNLDSEIIPC